MLAYFCFCSRCFRLQLLQLCFELSFQGRHLLHTQMLTTLRSGFNRTWSFNACKAFSSSLSSLLLRSATVARLQIINQKLISPKQAKDTAAPTTRARKPAWQFLRPILLDFAEIRPGRVELVNLQSRQGKQMVQSRWHSKQMVHNSRWYTADGTQQQMVHIRWYTADGAHLSCQFSLPRIGALGFET